MGRHVYRGATNGRWQRKRHKVLRGTTPIGLRRLAALLDEAASTPPRRIAPRRGEPEADR